MPTKNKLIKNKDPLVHVKNINKEIAARLKTSKLPMFIELATYKDLLDLHFRQHDFVITLTGASNAPQYNEAVYGSIKLEAAKLAKAAIDDVGAVYPGVWTEQLLYNLANTLLHIEPCENKADPSNPKFFLIVDTIDLERMRNGAPWPKGWDTNAAYSISPNARMEFGEYTPEAMNTIVATLATAVVSRVSLLCCDRYAPHVVMPDIKNQVTAYAKVVRENAGEAVNNWVYNVYNEDADMKENIATFSQDITVQLIHIASILAATGGMSETLVSAVMEKTRIAPSYPADGDVDDIEDPSFKISYMLSYEIPHDKVVTATCDVTPTYILHVACDKKPTATAIRMTGRMIKDIMTALIRFCISVMTDYPEIVFDYVNRPMKDDAPAEE